MSTSLDHVAEDVFSNIKSIRNDKESLRWIVCSFDNIDNWNMICNASGDDDIETLKDNINENDMNYALVRKTFQYDNVGGGIGDTIVTKFIFIKYRPSSLPMKRTKKLGIYEGQIKKIFSPYHMDLEIDTKDELSEDILENLIAEVSGVKDNTTDKAASTFLIAGKAVQAQNNESAKKSAKKKADTFATSFAGSSSGYAVNFEDLDEIKDAIADVRNDKTDTTWCICKYKDKKTIQYLGKGNGDVPNEFLDTCEDKNVCYGIFRVTEQIDQTTAVKFVYVEWVPQGVPVMLRGVISTHKSAVQPVFQPYHKSYSISSRDDLSYESVMDDIMLLSGTKSRVTDKKPTIKEAKYERKFLGGATAEKQTLDIENKDELLESIKNVRNDSSDINYTMSKFNINKSSKSYSLQFIQEGTDGMDGLKKLITSDEDVYFCFVRLIYKIDNTDAVKFLFIIKQGNKIPIWVKSQMGTKRGVIVELFHPFHADMLVDSLDDLNDKDIEEKIKSR